MTIPNMQVSQIDETEPMQTDDVQGKKPWHLTHNNALSGGIPFDCRKCLIND